MPSDPVFRDRECIGYVTSATISYRTGKTLALGYVRSGSLAMNAGCNVRVLGQDIPAVRQSPHVYDPENQKMKR